MSPPISGSAPKVPFNNLTAGQLANGNPKLVQPGDQLTKAQLDGVVDAFKKVPLKDLSPDALAVVKATIKKIENETGKKITVDYDKMTIDQLKSPVGGKVAKALADHLRKKDPAAFYTLATGAAGAAVGVAVTQGSAGLNKLGIPTHVGKNVKGLDLKLQTSWESGFEHAKAKGSVGHDFKKYGRARLEAGGGVDGFDKASGRYEKTGDTGANAGVTANKDGVESVSGGANVKVGPVKVGANGTANVQDGSKSGSVSVDVQVKKDVTVSGRASGSVDKDGKKKGSVSGDATYKGKKIDVVVSGSIGPDDKGRIDKRVGIGISVDLDRAPPKRPLPSESAPKVDGDVMARAVAKGEKAATAAELTPKGAPAGTGDPGAFASEIATKLQEAIRNGKASPELRLPEEYAKLPEAERKQIAAAIEKIAKAVAAEVPGSGKVASVKIVFGKETQHVAIR